MSDPRIALCLTCKGRTPHVEQTLPKNLESNTDYQNAVFIVLNFNSADNLLMYLVTNHKPAMKSGRLVVYSFGGDGPFRMAFAKNLAHRCGMLEGADILVNLDADNLTGPGFASYIARQFTLYNKDEIFLWARMIQGQLKRGVSGRIAMSSNSFVLAGGYDEKYDNWGPDDKDMNVRLQRLGRLPLEIESQYLDAIHHKDKLRFKEYPHARPAPGVGEDQFYLLNDATIANFGNIGCGTVYRNFDPNPIELKPLPTRIFGVGMHKTATTSLAKALNILGYDSAHWNSGAWAKAIYTEMTTTGRSKTLEKHYALTDLPIAILYRELDKAYPGSKFILTIRDEEKWLKSVRNHWSYDHNPFRWEWDVYPWASKMHKIVYGQKWFDPTVMLERYRRHNAEILSYFSGRPSDLLVLDMDLQPETLWASLCRFLAKPVPHGVSYPTEFATLVSKEFL